MELKARDNLIIRVDAYLRLGTGHLLRCLALAQGWKVSGGHVEFITHCESGKLLQRISNEGFDLHLLDEPGSLEETIAALKNKSAGWVVLDGYHFGSDYQKAIKDLGFKLLVIDDYAHLEHYCADIIMNQNYGAENFSYSAEPHTRLLLGTKYVLLRREFLQFKDIKRECPDAAGKVLVTMGGSDPENNTLKVLRAVGLIKERLDIKVIIGSGNSHYETIKEEADRGLHNMEVLQGVEDMAPLMAWADVAISAGGTTLWELAFMGLPALLCIVAENQEGAVTSLEKEGFPSAGWLKDVDEHTVMEQLKDLIYNKELRKTLVENGKLITDGRGVKRVMEELVKTQ